MIYLISFVSITLIFVLFLLTFHDVEASVKQDFVLLSVQNNYFTAYGILKLFIMYFFFFHIWYYSVKTQCNNARSFVHEDVTRFFYIFLFEHHTFFSYFSWYTVRQ